MILQEYYPIKEFCLPPKMQVGIVAKVGKLANQESWSSVSWKELPEWPFWNCGMVTPENPALAPMAMAAANALVQAQA